MVVDASYTVLCAPAFESYLDSLSCDDILRLTHEHAYQVGWLWPVVHFFSLVFVFIISKIKKRVFHLQTSVMANYLKVKVKVKGALDLLKQSLSGLQEHVMANFCPSLFACS